MRIKANNLTGLPEVAQQLINFAPDQKIFVFEGDMGAGKTTFIKALCQKLGVTDVVSSPTYSIVNEYIGAEKMVYHFDFYRIKNIQEAFDLGYEEYFYNDAYCLIEWPSKIGEILPDTYVKVEIFILSETERVFEFTRVSSV